MKGRILIVEDDPDVRRGLAIRLTAAGYDVATAADGASALASAQAHPPELVLLDVGLPGADGYAVMGRLRRIGRLAHVPFVVLSARDPEYEELRAKTAEAVAFVAKPPDPDHLLRVIAEHVWRVDARQGDAARILVVEDDQDTRLGLVIRLESQGFEVVEAVDGATAVAVAVRERPDLILLDLGLPAGDGLLLLQRFRGHGALSSVPVIVLSARDPATHRARALDAGAVEYFQKPADEGALLAAVRQALRRRAGGGRVP